MDRKPSLFFLLFAGALALLTSTSGCSGEGGIDAAANEAEAADDPDVEETTQTVLKEGLSCDAQAEIISMSPEDSQATRSALLDQLGQETLNDVVNNREECDAASFGLTEEPVSPDGVGKVQQAITGTSTPPFLFLNSGA